MLHAGFLVLPQVVVRNSEGGWMDGWMGGQVPLLAGWRACQAGRATRSCRRSSSRRTYGRSAGASSHRCSASFWPRSSPRILISAIARRSSSRIRPTPYKSHVSLRQHCRFPLGKGAGVRGYTRASACSGNIVRGLERVFKSKEVPMKKKRRKEGEKKKGGKRGNGQCQ